MKKKIKTIVLGVTSSIAAYKMTDVASSLTKDGYNVQVIMTKNATEIISPLTFSTLTGNKCIVDTFDKDVNYNVAHVAIAKQADLLFIAPATANTIAKLAYGMADNMLTTVALACTCPKVVSPAMNVNMYQNPVVQNNLKRLTAFGYEVIAPDTGVLACKDEGSGKLPKTDVLLEHIYRYTKYEKDMKGINVLVTAGATKEAIDPVRYITNHSSGKMGYALARNCMLRGAEVTVVSGSVSIGPVPFVNIINVKSSKEMFEVVKGKSSDQDIVIMAAAVSDYRPKIVYDSKLKKKDDELSIELERTDDILSWLGENKSSNQYICGFSMETENMLENSIKKLNNKKADMIVANNLNEKGAGFKSDTNVVTLITTDGVDELPIMSKDEVAEKIVNKIMEIGAPE
ncbi:MAG: bifunctional phosphopantothenoylcysteine decarboxylase/phosphopantothenate--cysteine ligase CoaBC [Peptostreptococcaceae bacterium]|nr:bifunctional phosphopantothenoylcysteine decarboxylase/phosphopantothenate--cysteine ligase CoaBC [Peptostreptococcaceae bacterium]